MKRAAGESDENSRNLSGALDDHRIALTASEKAETEGLVEDELLGELQRRSAAYRAGQTTARSAAEVIADLRQRQADERQP